MVVQIKRGKTHSFAYRFGFLIIVALFAIGLILRFSGHGQHANKELAGGSESHLFSLKSTDLIVPRVQLEVENPELEKPWVAALAKTLNGQAEEPVEFGRVDVATKSYAIEVDFIRKWKEGLGQSIHYGAVTKKTPVLALIVDGADYEKQALIDLLGHIDKIASEKGVKVVILEKENIKR